MMDESVQMSLVHFIATRRPNRNGWDKEVFALKKAWRSSPLEVSICNTPCRPCFKTMVGDYGVAAAQTCQPERHAALDREISIRQRRRNNSGSKKSGSEARRARQIPARSFASRGARYKPFPHGGRLVLGSPTFWNT